MSEKPAPWLENWRDQVGVNAPTTKSISYALPNPQQFAERLPQHFRIALIGAYQSKAMGWCVDATYAPELRKHGLVAARSIGLTAFGISVREEAMRMPV